MADFVLIHGSCHGAWCWRDLTPRLSARGHNVHAIDLPGMGADTTPIGDVTLDHYRLAILSTLDSLDAPAILVGHSAGGYPITAAAQAAPEKIAHLVYVCAYTPAPGKSMVRRRMDAPRQPLLASIEKSANGKSYTVRDADLRAAFYGDCTEEQIEYARRHLRPQPIGPQDTPIHLDPVIRTLPKTYVRCLRDGAVPSEFQLTMCEEWPEMTRHDLDSDHSPFFSHPDKLAEILHETTRL